MEQELIKASVFYEDTYASRYILRSGVRNWDLLDVPGKANLENLGVTIDTEPVFLGRKEIFRCEISLPLLKVGDKFLIEEQSKLVTIKDIHRTSKDNVCYIVTDKWIEDEETNNTYSAKVMEFWKWYRDRYNFEDYLKLPARYRKKNEYDEKISYSKLLKV